MYTKNAEPACCRVRAYHTHHAQPGSRNRAFAPMASPNARETKNDDWTVVRISEVRHGNVVNNRVIYRMSWSEEERATRLKFPVFLGHSLLCTRYTLSQALGQSAEPITLATTPFHLFRWKHCGHIFFLCPLLGGRAALLSWICMLCLLHHLQLRPSTDCCIVVLPRFFVFPAHRQRSDERYQSAVTSPDAERGTYQGRVGRRRNIRVGTCMLQRVRGTQPPID